MSSQAFAEQRLVIPPPLKDAVCLNGVVSGSKSCAAVCLEGAVIVPGFVSYHGMAAEQFLWAWLRSELLEPKRLKFEPVNIYYEALKDGIAEREKEALIPHDKKH